MRSPLPYYVANLNIEATYQAVAGQYAEYPNLCFVDTLDNIGGLGIKSGHQFDMFASVSDENVARVKRQNKRKISVVIGNPPYNANQQNENDNNKNRTYPHIDGLIKRSFVKLSTAQKTKVYDMYARFFRWASDRLHDDGVIAFVTNRSFIESRTFDGFRRYVAEEFDEIYLVDLGGDVRANPKLSGTKNNVFGIQTGVAISFFVRRQLGKKKKRNCKIRYVRRPELKTSDDKLAWLSAVSASDAKYEEVKPDAKANWINQTENDWDDLLPVADKRTKAAKVKSQERAIFKRYVSGIKTNRDEWSYSFDKKTLNRKYDYLRKIYDAQKSENFDGRIKWSRDLKNKWRGKVKLTSRPPVTTSMWRPFVTRAFIWSKPMNDIFYEEHVKLFGGNGNTNTPYFSISGTSAAKPFQVLAGESARDYEAVEKNNLLPCFFHGENGERIDNITDWAFNKFTAHYSKNAKITKDDIFAYV
jgi:predicted helicase